MMTKTEKRTSRKEANHRYYMKNHTKWNAFYPATDAARTGTGNLGAHRLDNEKDEIAAIQREMRHLGIQNLYTKNVRSGGNK